MDRVIVVPLPIQGHFTPLVYLAKKLAEQGISITIVNVEHIHKICTNVCWPSDLDIRLESLPLNLHAPEGLGAYYMDHPAEFAHALSNLEPEFVKLMNRLMEEGVKVKFIISDQFVYWGYNVAKQLGIPHAVYWPGNGAWCETEYYLSQLLATGEVPLTEFDLSAQGTKIIHFPGIGALKPSEVPSHFNEEMLALIGSELPRKASECLKMSSWILVNTVEEMEETTLNALRAHVNKNTIAIGPLFPLGGEPGLPGLNLVTPECTKCMEWLDSKAPDSVLYVSFGSLAILPALQVEQFARGLKASGVSCLWVMRSTLVKASVDFFKSLMGENSLVISWAPQRELLCHPAVGAFLTHCGWNSVFESVSSGVPMLTFPCIYDQPLNCKIMIEEWKVAVPLSKNSDGIVTSEEVECVVRELFQKEARLCELKANCAKLKETAARVTNEGGSSSNNLLSFVKAIKAKLIK